MFNDGSGFKKVYLATGFTDLCRGIDGLAGLYVFSSSWILTIRYILLILWQTHGSHKRTYLGRRRISPSVQAD